MVGTQVEANSVKAVLSPAAQTRLTSDGLLRITSEIGEGEISEIDAGKLAEAFLRTHMAGLEPTLEEDRGGEISIASLKTCGRAFYAATPLAAPSESVPLPYRRSVGSWWIFNFCGISGAPEVSLAISSLASDVEIVDGRLRYPSFSGNEFLPMGVHTGAPDGFPGTPESAALMAARVTGLAVAEVPELVWIPGRYPQLSQWRINLEETASGPGSGIARREVYVGYDTKLRKWVVRVPAAPQRPAVELAWHRPMDGKPSRTVTHISRRPGRPLDFVLLEGQ